MLLGSTSTTAIAATGCASSTRRLPNIPISISIATHEAQSIARSHGVTVKVSTDRMGGLAFVKAQFCGAVEDARAAASSF